MFGLAKAALGTAAAFEAGRFLEGAIKAGEALHKSQESLQKALEATGAQGAKLLPQFEEMARKAADFGISETAATDALSRATLITGDAQAAQRAYAEALVLSKALHVDLNAAITATSKGQDGITTSLRRYGVLVDATSTGQEQYNAVMKRYADQAAANTEATDKLHANLQNLQAHIGEALLPAFNKLVEGMDSAVVFMQAHWPEIQRTVQNVWQQVKPILSGLVDAFMAIANVVRDNWPTISRNLQAVGQVVQDVAKIIAASLRLVADLIHGDWSKAWADLKAIVAAVIDGVKTILQNQLDNIKGLTMALGKAAYNGFVDGITGIGAFFLGVVSGLKDMVSNAIGGMRAAASGLGHAFVDGISSGLSGLGDALARLIKAPFNAIVDAWNSIGFHVHIPGFDTHIPGAPKWGGADFGFEVPQLPHLAAGGIVTKPTLAVIGESGPEAVVPLGQMGGGSLTVNFNGPVYGADADELVRQIRASLLRMQKRGIALGLEA